MKKRRGKFSGKALALLLAVFSMVFLLATYKQSDNEAKDTSKTQNGANTETKTDGADIASLFYEIPEYSGMPYVEVNGNMPLFAESELVTEAFERYSPLDSLGRCGTAYANICKELMPTQERGTIGSVKPSGWHTVKYDIVDGKYLYHRCHLIGYQLAGENANVQNLITGTSYLNIDGMLPFENMVADYVKETGNHVLYRVTPMFEGENLLAAGVFLEAKSVEDGGEGILFCVFCYNVQPGVSIDYAMGESSLAPTPSGTNAAEEDKKEAEITYVLNKNTKKFHFPSCTSAKKIAAYNKEEVEWNRKECIANGYEPCGNCKP